MVAELELVNACTTLPNLTLQGEAIEQLAPMVNVLVAVRLAARSVSWLALWVPAPLLSRVQTLLAVQP
jgi:hypothetical protein